MLFGIGCTPALVEESSAVDPSSAGGAAARGVAFLVCASFVGVAERRRRARSEQE
jgi:hypothetical protein